jgi:hypothetical protein
MKTLQQRIYNLINAINNFIHEHYQEYIQEAFEYFWEEERPEEFLQGILLDIGEINFEDWLTIDYRTPYGESFLDLYREFSTVTSATKEVSEEERVILDALKKSRISLYEVESKSQEGIVIKDLITQLVAQVTVERYRINSEALNSFNLSVKKIKVGELFATRLIKLNGEIIMGRCVYPFRASLKDEVLRYIDMQFKRYLKNENPSGNIESFLKDASSIFNTIWVTTIGIRD